MSPQKSRLVHAFDVVTITAVVLWVVAELFSEPPRALGLAVLALCLISVARDIVGLVRRVRRHPRESR